MTADNSLSFDYRRRFGLRRQPFRRVRPDDGLDADVEQRRSLLRLGQRLVQGDSVALIVGVPGTGKTLFARRLRSVLNTPATALRPHLLRSPPQTEIELDQILDRSCRGAAGDTAERFEQPLRRHRGTVLIVDEADHLPAALARRLFALTARRGAASLQLVLCGSTTLPERLRHSAAAAIPRDAIETLSPLSLQQTERFIQRELLWARLAPGDGPETDTDARRRMRSEPFPAAVIGRIHQHSLGVQGQIAKMCDRALLAAHLSDADRISVALVDEVAASLLINGIADSDPDQTITLPRPTLSAPLPDRPCAAERPAAAHAAPTRRLNLGVALALWASGLSVVLYPPVSDSPNASVRVVASPLFWFGDVSRVSSDDLALRAKPGAANRR